MVRRVDGFVVSVDGLGVTVGTAHVDGHLLSLGAGHVVVAGRVIGGMRCCWHAEEGPSERRDKITTRLDLAETSPVR